jgi:acid phosphatase
MNARSYVLIVVSALVAFGLGWSASLQFAATPVVPAPPASSSAPAPPPTSEPSKTAPAKYTQANRLSANLYMQTAAEYKAVCLQTYALATLRLKEKLKDLPKSDKKPGIVMDLDETVVDNAKYQSLLCINNLEYSEASWEVYEAQFPHEVALIPGAKEFITEAEKLGCAVVYLSNRFEKNRAGTVKALELLGLDTKDLEPRLILKTDASSNKTNRRKLASERFNVIMWVGDNLRDFDEKYAAKLAKDADTTARGKAIDERWQLVETDAAHWGTDWFILPNPAYGEWERLISVDTPTQQLRPTQIPVPAPPAKK